MVSKNITQTLESPIQDDLLMELEKINGALTNNFSTAFYIMSESHNLFLEKNEEYKNILIKSFDYSSNKLFFDTLIISFFFFFLVSMALWYLYFKLVLNKKISTNSAKKK